VRKDRKGELNETSGGRGKGEVGTRGKYKDKRRKTSGRQMLIHHPEGGTENGLKKRDTDKANPETGNTKEKGGRANRENTHRKKGRG